MTIKIFRGSNFNTIAQRIRVWRSSINDWTFAKKISVYRDAGGLPYWSIIYPDKPVSISTPSITGNGVPGSNFDVNSISIWNTQGYVAPTSITYQWQRSTSGTGPWSNVGSLLTTYSPYLVQASDSGYYFRLVITGTNEAGSTTVQSSISVRVSVPDYTFNFNQEFGVNANALILFDKTDGVFPPTENVLVLGRLLSYFSGDYKHFEIFYRSDSTTFRIYHRMYRNDRATRPSAPDMEYEIVFTNGSKIVDIFVINPVDKSYIYNYVAYWQTLTPYKEYNSNDYMVGKRFRVTMDGTTPVSSANAQPSTTSPSFLNGWIYISSGSDSSNATVPFLLGVSQSSPSAPQLVFSSPNSAFNKQNMYYPKTPTVDSVTYSTTNSAVVSWSYPSFDQFNAKSYAVQVLSSTNTILSTQYTQSNSITITNLSVGTSYTIRVYPNSSSDYYGQYGISGSRAYTHSGPPGAPTNVSGTAGNSSVALTWTAPSSNGGSAITGYTIRHSSNGGVSWSNPINTGSTATSFTVTNLNNGTSYIFQVAAINSGGTGPWSASSASITPQITATKLAISLSSTSIQTLGVSTTVTVQLQNNNNNNVPLAGRSITVSSSNTNIATILSPSTVTTDNTGKATFTAVSGSNGGQVSISATSSPLTQASTLLTVTLRPPFNPLLTWTRQSYGGMVSQTPDFNYTYSGTISFPGTLASGNSYGSSSFNVQIPVTNGVNRPEISGDNTNGTGYAGTVTCTISNVWVVNPEVTVTVTTTRAGYNTGSGSLFNVQGNRSRLNITYELVNEANGNIIYSITTNNTSVSYRYPGSDVGKTVRWRCTALFSDFTTDTRTSANTRILG